MVKVKVSQVHTGKNVERFKDSRGRDIGHEGVGRLVVFFPGVKVTFMAGYDDQKRG